MRLTNSNRRLARLERRAQKLKPKPMYLSFPDEEAYEAWLNGPDVRPVKCYIGWSPDDWDKEDEQGN